MKEKLRSNGVINKFLVKILVNCLMIIEKFFGKWDNLGELILLLGNVEIYNVLLIWVILWGIMFVSVFLVWIFFRGLKFFKGFENSSCLFGNFNEECVLEGVEVGNFFFVFLFIDDDVV